MLRPRKYTNAFTVTFDISEAETNGLKYQDIDAWDSVGHMGLIAAVEEAFGIMMDPDDIVDFSSFEKSAITKKTKEIKRNIEQRQSMRPTGSGSSSGANSLASLFDK